jgi:hypothetical protein
MNRKVNAKPVKAWVRVLDGAFWVDDERLPVLWKTRKDASSRFGIGEWKVVRVTITVED